MIVWQLIPLFFVVVTVYASEFDAKSKNMALSAIDNEVVDASGFEDSMIKLEETVPVKSAKLVVKTEEPISEDEQMFAFMEIMNIIGFICEKALQREDKMTFANNWIGAIFELAKEAYVKQVYDKFGPDSDDEDEFDRKTLIPKEELDFFNMFKHGSYDILYSSPEGSDSSYSSDSEHSEIVQESDGDMEVWALIKSKMNRATFSDYKEDDYESDYSANYSDCKGELAADGKSEPLPDDEEEEKKQPVVRESYKNSRLRRRNRGGMLGGVLNTDNLNLAADLMTSTMTSGSKVEGQSGGIEEIVSGSSGLNSTGLPSGIDSSELMVQMQQQVMEQVMAQLAQSNPQLAQYGSILQDERAKFEAAMGGESSEMTKEGMIEFLKTSALPKLINSAIKGKTGIDLLRSLSMLLRSLNEGLGIVEVILKTLLRITRAVRYYSLCIADVVNEMAREDNLRPIVDLSVSLDSVPIRKKSGGRMKKMTSFFRKSRKSAEGADGSDAEHEMSPFTMGIHAALCKARDYTSEFQKFPPILLLRLIHTIFAELDKRNGIIRVALARKQHKTLIGMQDEINSAVEQIFEAVMLKDEEASIYLHSISPMMITEILISLISPVKIEPAIIEKHVVEVTKWIKPLMVFMNQEAQINLLNYLLTDPDAEVSFRKSQGISEERKIVRRNFGWTPSKSLIKKKTY